MSLNTFGAQWSCGLNITTDWIMSKPRFTEIGADSRKIIRYRFRKCPENRKCREINSNRSKADLHFSRKCEFFGKIMKMSEMTLRIDWKHTRMPAGPPSGRKPLVEVRLDMNAHFFRVLENEKNKQWEKTPSGRAAALSRFCQNFCLLKFSRQGDANSKKSWLDVSCGYKIL